MISPEALPSRRFKPLRYGLGAWTEHIFFAYDLVTQSRPKLLVELGTDRGESYFAFCQSVQENKTGTRCFAVDHWRGDPHAGSYDEATFTDVSGHNNAHYADFSTLLRSSFDEALTHFADGSIDLLHIDGHHTEAAARHDVDAWLPKLRPGGILLMHDVAVRARDFGVWKVWEELVARRDAFAFSTPPGLGVWRKPGFAGATPPLLNTLFTAPNESCFALLVYYQGRNAALHEKMARQWRDGSIRAAPLASETVIQVFWRGEGGYSEEESADARVGHGSWKEVVIPLPAREPVRGLRIDFFSALTIVEIEEITVNNAPVQLEALSLGGDCVRLSVKPLRLQITGMDPQLYPQAFTPPLPREGLIVQMRLRVDPA